MFTNMTHRYCYYHTQFNIDNRKIDLKQYVKYVSELFYVFKQQNDWYSFNFFIPFTETQRVFTLFPLTFRMPSCKMG